MKLIIVSGLAGAGKSVVLQTLEDIGYFSIDNLPLAMLRDVSASTLTAEGLDYERLALGIDTRAGRERLADLPQRIDNLRAAGVDVELMFVTADPGTILGRFDQTRRRHPLATADLALPEAIRADRDALSAIEDSADVTIDTSRTNIHELRDIVRNRVESGQPGSVAILLQSFGFKHGIPDGVDFCFDARCLPNPYWDPELRQATGRDPGVAAFFEADQATQTYLTDLSNFFETWLPAFAHGDRAYVTIAIGCTGGNHRSVYLVEQLAKSCRAHYEPVIVRHNEIG
ncbi:RNase adapter RapZ [Salinisphaera sp. USBA-960]|nr:RNase adapter RapZ [Salifodinibacter halophilus]NNC26787.1 RNase adapter RapZ [Salifodinibacter halophilus]